MPPSSQETAPSSPPRAWSTTGSASAGRPHFLVTLVAVLSASLLLCLPALWNGQPFFYPDTPTYLRGAEMGFAKVVGAERLKPWIPANEASTPEAGQPDSAHPVKPISSVHDKVVLAGRSVYYGALLYASHLAGSLWLVVVVQALCVVYLLHLLMVRLWRLGEGQLILAVGALTLLSPLAVYSGLLMPDVFAGLGILAVATLAVHWRALSRTDRIALALLLLFGLCAHASHVAVVAVMLLALVAVRALNRRWHHVPVAALAIVGSCIAGAVAAEWAFGQAVTRAVGAPPLRLPHAMARLVDMGPGTDYLERHCPQAGYAACAYRDNFPTEWDQFLFSADPRTGAFALADAAGKRRMSEEQLRFVADVLRHDPLGVAQGLALDVLRQLVSFRMDVWGYGQREFAMYEGRVPDAVLARMKSSRGAYTLRYGEWLSVAIYLGTAAALAAPLWLRRRLATEARAGGAAREPFLDFMWIAAFGVVANAVLCALLASSLDRFQARVIWILPFLALSALAIAYGRRRFAKACADTPSNPIPQGVAP